MKTVTTIIFDLAEVYLKGLIGVEHILEPILGLSAKEIYPRLQGEDLASLFHGEISEDEYWQRIVKKNDWKVENGVLKKAIRENFEEIEGTREIIEQLKEKGYKLGLLSVHTKEWIEHCNKKFDYHKLFDSILYSFEVAASKPDKKVYKLILERLKAAPEECVFIDDSPVNLIPAEELGIKTIHFENPKQLKKELVSLGINLD
ncbi:HAD family phosphatase [Patescibacteria group bacterium AH-259-L07]|nr:HAD family phosphatase [Patescibacteria group bacterium AH-259-L07]